MLYSCFFPAPCSLITKMEDLRSSFLISLLALKTTTSTQLAPKFLSDLLLIVQKVYIVAALVYCCYTHLLPTALSLISAINLDLQKMDSPYNIDAFSSLNDVHATWTLTSVRVECVWEDVREQRVFIFLLDRNRTKMVAIVHHIRLIRIYTQMNLVGGVFQMNRFRLGHNLNDWRYEGYGFASGEWTILIEPYTTFIPLMMDVQFDFPFYPLVHSIRTLVEDRSRRKSMIDVVGKIIAGRRRGSFRNHGFLIFGCLEIFLQDGPGNIIKMRLYDSTPFRFGEIARAITNKSIIYASRVKLIHLHANNVLNSTELTTIVVEPHMPEADAVRIMMT